MFDCEIILGTVISAPGAFVKLSNHYHPTRNPQYSFTGWLTVENINRSGVTEYTELNLLMF